VLIDDASHLKGQRSRPLHVLVYVYEFVVSYSISGRENLLPAKLVCSTLEGVLPHPPTQGKRKIIGSVWVPDSMCEVAIKE